jgi:6-phosphogluconolactonase/glucosamine-6-phosphate isomerase/deaminase
VEILQFPAISEVALAVAGDIAAYIKGNPGALMCFAAGDTPLPVFRALAEMNSKGEVDLNSVFYVGLDEWVGLGMETAGSCAQVMRDEFYGPAGIKEDRICVWDGLAPDMGAERNRIETWLSGRGGIGLALLGVGMNGHVGFNEPHTGVKERTVITPLDGTTKAVSVKYFKKVLPVEYGVSIGTGELKKARKVILMATGALKAEILCRAFTGGPDETVPASLLADHENISLYADDAAV